MEIITTLASVFAVLVLFVCLIGVCGFVVWGAWKLNDKRKQSGIDAAELTILRGLFADEAKATKESELKAKLSRVAAPPKPVSVRPVAAPQI